ncbi:MAG: hypothetical protein IPO04_19570 [Cytophagaceae bacterium]|nr:hypothetical protein [Cytophagaceae bacterium]
MELSSKLDHQGGVYADEPEVMNSLRHFYDPTPTCWIQASYRSIEGYFGVCPVCLWYLRFAKIDGVE